MIRGNYILRDGQPVAEPDTLTWATWFETADRRVAVTTLLDQGTKIARISTVFLGTDHDWTAEGPPVLWETMTFFTDPDRVAAVDGRYTSRKDAALGHRRVVDEVVARLTDVLPEIVEEYL